MSPHLPPIRPGDTVGELIDSHNRALQALKRTSGFGVGGAFVSSTVQMFLPRASRRAIRPFELKENLLTGDHAEAHWLQWDGDSWEPRTPHYEPVYDSFGLFRGWGRDNHSPGVRGWAERASSNRWEIISNLNTFWGKLDEQLTTGSSATVSIWAGIPLADTTVNLTAHDWFLGAGDSLASDAKVKVEYISGRFYVTGSACS